MSDKKNNSDNLTLTFHYTHAVDYASVYANGARGVTTPHGEIIIDFYFERPSIPKHQVLALTSDGTLGIKIEDGPASSTKNNDFDRRVVTGVIMDHKTALNIRNLINRAIDVLEKRNTTAGQNHGSTDLGELSA